MMLQKLECSISLEILNHVVKLKLSHNKDGFSATLQNQSFMEIPQIYLYLTLVHKKEKRLNRTSEIFIYPPIFSNEVSVIFTK